MRVIAAVAVLFLALPLVADRDPRIGEGIALHKAGKYDEAIAKYKAVLAEDPANASALYEMAYSYETKGDLAQCRAVLEPIADKSDRMQPLILNMLGNCLDKAGEGKRAIEVFRKGLKIAPENGYLLYHLAVALVGQKQKSEAKEVLIKELAVRPGHASGHYLLGQLFEEENARVPAILEYLRMLGYEAGTPRAEDAAQRLVKLLNLGVDKAAAGEFDKARARLASAIRKIVQAPPEGDDSTVRQNVAFFAELEKRKLLDTYAAIAVGSLHLDGVEEWAKDALDHPEAAQQLVAYLVTFPR